MNSSKPTFLYIENDPELRRLIVGELKSKGIDVHSAENGRDALGILKNRSIDVVISDLEMSELDGIQLRKLAIAELKKLPKVWVGFSGAVRIDIESLKQIGFDEILFKPLSVSMLFQVCNSLLNKQV